MAATRGDGPTRTRAWLAAAAAAVVAVGLGLVVAADEGLPRATSVTPVGSHAASPATPTVDAELRERLLAFAPLLAGHDFRSDGPAGLVAVDGSRRADEAGGSVACAAFRQALSLETPEDAGSRRGDLYANLGYLQEVGGGAAVSTLAIELRVFGDVDAPPAAVSAVAASTCTELIASVDVVDPDGRVHTLVVTAPVLGKERIAQGDPAVCVRMGPAAMSEAGGAPWHDSARADAVDDRTYLVARGAILIRIRATDVADPDQAALAIAGQLLDHLGA